MSRRIPHNLKRYDVQTRTTRQRATGPNASAEIRHTRPKPQCHEQPSHVEMDSATGTRPSPQRVARRYGQRHSRTKLLTATNPTAHCPERTRCAAAPHRWPERTYNPPVRPALGTTGPSANPQKTVGPPRPPRPRVPPARATDVTLSLLLRGMRGRAWDTRCLRASLWIRARTLLPPAPTVSHMGHGPRPCFAWPCAIARVKGGMGAPPAPTALSASAAAIGRGCGDSAPAIVVRQLALRKGGGSQ